MTRDAVARSGWFVAALYAGWHAMGYQNVEPGHWWVASVGCLGTWAWAVFWR